MSRASASVPSTDAVTAATVRLLSSSTRGDHGAATAGGGWFPTVDGRFDCGTDCGTAEGDAAVIVYVAIATAAVVVLVHAWSVWDAVFDDRGEPTERRTDNNTRTVGRECIALAVAAVGAALFLRDVTRCRNQTALYKLAGALVLANVVLPWWV